MGETGCFCLGLFRCKFLVCSFCIGSFFSSPYYVWLGCSRSVNVSAALEAFETDSGNSVGNYSPKSIASTRGLKRVTSLVRLGGSDSEVEVLEQINPPSSAFHYHSQTVSFLFNPSHCLMASFGSPGVFRTIPMRCTKSSERLYMPSRGRIRWKI